MARANKSIEDIIRKARKVWKKNFKRHMSAGLRAEFGKDMDTLAAAYTADTKDYTTFLGVAHENRSAFLALTELPGSPVAGDSFYMRDLFNHLYLRVAREFVESDAFKGKMEAVRVYGEIQDGDTLLLINPIGGQFELLEGTEESTRDDVVMRTKTKYRASESEKVVAFDNQGALVSSTPKELKREITNTIVSEGVVYRVTGKLDS